MTNGGCLLTVTFYGSEKVVAEYNLMGPVKLESSVWNMAGKKCGVPVNRHVDTLTFVAMLCGLEPAFAASALDGTSMTWPWSLPFIGILASIATGPLLFPKVWHDHYGKIAFGWAALALACMAIFNGIHAALATFVQSILREYLSFILLLFALYTVAGGILVAGRIHASPWTMPRCSRSARRSLV
jgi:hypothetical protein